MQGVAVGLVTKLAGHPSAVVTLWHYNQTVHGAEATVVGLQAGVRDRELIGQRAAEMAVRRVAGRARPGGA